MDGLAQNSKILGSCQPMDVNSTDDFAVSNSDNQREKIRGTDLPISDAVPRIPNCLVSTRK